MYAAIRGVRGEDTASFRRVGGGGATLTLQAMPVAEAETWSRAFVELCMSEVRSPNTSRAGSHRSHMSQMTLTGTRAG